MTNLAQAGVSEYKILKQLKSITSINQFDIIVVSHTSPYRVHTRQSIHSTLLHKDSDLLPNDVHSVFFSINPVIRSAQSYFRYHFDPDYYEDIYGLIRKEIDVFTNDVPTLHIDHLNNDHGLYGHEKHCLNLNPLWNSNKGSINHYTDKGNQLVCSEIKQTIQTMLKQGVIKK